MIVKYIDVSTLVIILTACTARDITWRRRSLVSMSTSVLTWRTFKVIKHESTRIPVPLLTG